MNKYILSKEKTITNIIYRDLQKWQKDFVALLKKYDTQKDFSLDIKDFLNARTTN